MPSCEKCWFDAHRGEQFSVAEEYERLIRERWPPCTPEEQAGPDRTLCPECKRTTVHQYAGVCMVCGHDTKGTGTAKAGES